MELADITLKKKLRDGNVYLIDLTLENEKGVDIHYYTRIKYGTELHFSECMEFINEFHDAALDGGTTGNEYVSKYLEPSESNLNNDLSKVDIHSNNDIVCYAGMKPIVEERISGNGNRNYGRLIFCRKTDGFIPREKQW